MKLALVVPHIFMNQELLPRVIFSPGQLALTLSHGLAELGHEVTLFTPGSVADLLESNHVHNVTADLAFFAAELEQRQDDYLALLKKHPLTFITLSRQVQSELTAQAYQLANEGRFDLVHVWCNEEEHAVINARFCQKPVVFNHHEPFNFLVRYRSIFPKYAALNWISISFAQRQTFAQQQAFTEQAREERQAGSLQQRSQQLPAVNWVGNVYHGLNLQQFQFNSQPKDYLLYMGRVIRPKGVHYAIVCAKQLQMKLKIAGKHYAGHSKDQYWQEFVEPELDHDLIEYVGYIKEQCVKQKLLGQAQVLLMPSIWQEPFGLVMLEAMACGTPIAGFEEGAVAEVVKPKKSGALAAYQAEEKVFKNGKAVNKSWQQLQQDSQFQENVKALAQAAAQAKQVDRAGCRAYFAANFSSQQMCQGYEQIYKKLIDKQNNKNRS